MQSILDQYFDNVATVEFLYIGTGLTVLHSKVEVFAFKKEYLKITDLTNFDI